MHVYQCHYRGMNGYCCRKHNASWMFVPELGEASPEVQKNVSLHELEFHNTFAKSYELALEGEKKLVTRLFAAIKGMLLPGQRSMTLGGRLFAQVS